MKKKFRITEEQAKKILNLDEATQNQQSSSSVDPCVAWTSQLAPSVSGAWTPGTIALGGPASDFGDIDCCEMLAGNMVGPFGGTAQNSQITNHCDTGWSQAVLGYGTFAQGNQLNTSLGWAPCCGDAHDGPCPPQDSNSPFYTNNLEFCYGCPIQTHYYYNHVDCPCCDEERTNTSTKCPPCDVPGEYRLNGQCTKCTEDVNKPGCCKGDGRTNTSTGDGCPEIVCDNPNHVQGPPPECECGCPEGSGEKGCKKPYGNWNPDECCCADKKGNCDPKSVVGPALQSKTLAPKETKDQKELREEMTRIKQLLK
tara:strand:+ start:13294 stop:14226 length:933 start_codon:yes stop_codon:yes gene_type:complete